VVEARKMVDNYGMIGEICSRFTIKEHLLKIPFLSSAGKITL